MADAPNRDQSVTVPDTGLSQLAARVLGQLSLSAWLPAALLTLVGTLVVQFAGQGAIDLGEAIESLTRDKWAVVLLVVPVLVIATLVTQAFSFEAIRALEGYWHHGGLVRVAQSFLINRQLLRKRQIHDQRITLSHRAFVQSRGAWLDAGFSTPLVNALERSSRDTEPIDDEEIILETDLRKLEFLNWRTRCSPIAMSRVYHLSRAEEDYPSDHRVLPTRLGNIMRATEDRLGGAEKDVEGFALRHRQAASPRVQLQHDQFRTRLDMYCTLVYVSLVLCLISPVVLTVWVLYPSDWALDQILWTLVLTTGLAGLVWSSYNAAIASARGYLTALIHMDPAAPARDN